MVTLKVKQLNFLESIVGLIGVKKPYPVFFKTHFGIHTFGLSFPIDVLILNNQNRVVRLSENLAPNHIFIWPIVYNQVVELPENSITKTGIKIGDLVKLVSADVWHNRFFFISNKVFNESIDVGIGFFNGLFLEAASGHYHW